VRLRLDVVVLSYNGLADTLKCLGSLHDEAARDPGTRVVLVDNGSTDGTAAVVAERFPWCEIVRVEQNAGPANGNNRGIEHVMGRGTDWVVLLNNDTTVTGDFLARMRGMAEHPQGFSILGPVINYMDEPDVLMTDGVRFNPPGYLGFFERIPVPLDEAWPAPVTEVDVVNACCMMVAAGVFERIGLFDPSLFIYHDETDFCLRAKLAGFRAGVFARQLVWHKGSRSFVSTGKRFQRYYDARNLGFLVKRYAGRVGGGRGRVASTLVYLRHMYHRYCVEREHGQAQAADAVIEGVVDAFGDRRGPYVEGRRTLVPMIRAAFDAAHRRPAPSS
jgi:GT2 family glycosyltransferase